MDASPISKAESLPVTWLTLSKVVLRQDFGARSNTMHIRALTKVAHVKKGPVVCDGSIFH